MEMNRSPLNMPAFQVKVNPTYFTLLVHLKTDIVQRPGTMSWLKHQTHTPHVTAESAVVSTRWRAVDKRTWRLMYSTNVAQSQVDKGSLGSSRYSGRICV